MNNIIVTVDVVLLTLIEGELNVVLTKRTHEPFSECHSLPGGYVKGEADENVLSAAKRVLSKKVGAKSPYLEQLQVFSGSDRDPRGFSVSIAHFALLPYTEIQLNANSCFEKVSNLPKLPFDHKKIIECAVNRLKTKGAYSSLPCYLANEFFTLSELQTIYSAVLGSKVLHKANFRKKIEEMGILVEVEGVFQEGAHRPAKLYSLKPEYKENPYLLLNSI